MNELIRRLTNQPDFAIALGLLVLGEFEALLLPPDAPLWGQAALTLVWSVPLVWRRRWPIPVLAVVIVVGPTIELVNQQGGVNSYALSAILAAYTVGRELDPPLSWWGPALTVGYNWIAGVVLGGILSDFVFTALLYGGAWVVGHAIRRRDLQVDEFAQETEELRRSQAERERMAVAEERVRIARELHDIVSHSISVITIQTQAVRRRLGRDHASEINDLKAVETTARQAMAEMRRLLGVLRADGDPVNLSPQPGLDQLERLVAETISLGVPVDLEVVGDPVPLTPGVDLAAYRIAQEALTNVRRHANGAHTTVLVCYSPGFLEVRVENDTAAPSNITSGRRGLTGMRERVALYGGTLDVGQSDGRFRVQAKLPLKSVEASP
jgi:signal transduction histidine kinase